MDKVHPDFVLPRVVVAGRPNVGKSTLFNRLIKKRKAITDPMPGVTRDAIEELCTIGSRSFILVDTGGYKTEAEFDFDDIVSQRSLETLESADLVILLLDVNEITGEDEIFLEKLRTRNRNIMLAVNKVDSPEKENDIWNFYSLGIEKIVGISAVHNRNMDEFREMLLSSIDFTNIKANGSERHDYDICLSILGRPNAGKSTLTNLLTRSENSLVSPVAGTTRDVITGYFNYGKTVFKVLDTAGIRKKKKVKEDVEYYSVNRALKSISESDIVILMIDAVDGLGEQDKKIAQQIVKYGKGVVLVLNKWDEKEDTKASRREAEDKIRFLFPVLGFAPLLLISALNNEGVDSLLKTLISVNKQLNRRIETSELNSALREWTDFNPSPVINGKSYKVRYITQVSAAPVKFIMFVNRPNGFPESYQRFIVNQIRKEFRFGNIPLEVEIKESRKKNYAESRS